MSIDNRPKQYEGFLFKESLDIVMGAEQFELILVLFAASIHPIGRFVKGFLRQQENVLKTRTVLVWPTQSEE